MPDKTSNPHRPHLFRQLEWDDLDPDWVRALIQNARAEDLDGAGFLRRTERPGDATTNALAGATHQAQATLNARHPLTIAGLPLLPLVLEAYGHPEPARACAFHARDGDQLGEGAFLATLEGPANILLQAERILLNFLQRLSGIATLTAECVAALEGSTTRLLDTRKTTPGLRALEKYAVARGGGGNHRLGLYDRIMLKDNHLAASGSARGARLADLVQQARLARPDLPVEVEVDDIEQIPHVLDAGPDVILLDNFSRAELKKALSLIGDSCFTEASGSITLSSLSELGSLGLDFISSGALIHKAQWADIGLDWK